MKITPKNEDFILAQSVFDLFSQKPGSEHIASCFALSYLNAMLRTKKPKSILEFGAGIGTITYLLLSHPSNIESVVATENNPFCLEQLNINLTNQMKQRVEIVAELKGLVKFQQKFDLVIFDGGFNQPEQYKFLEKGAVCFIEGARKATRRAIEMELSKRDLKCIFTNYNRGKKLFSMRLRKSKKTGFTYPRFKIGKIIKGCWIGEVA